MAFCTRCGQRLIEGEVHACQETAAGAAGYEAESNLNPNPNSYANPNYANWNPGAPAQSHKVDAGRVFSLFKNPERAKELQPDKDFLYGVLGIVASLLGFLIWAWLFNKKISDLLNDMFGFGDDSIFGLYSASSHVSSKLIGKLFLLGIISMAALLASLWLAGNWRGSRKLSAKELITYIGGMQYTFAAGFVITGLFTFVSLRFSYVLLFINLLMALVTTVLSASEISEVPKERRFSYIILGISIYLVLFWLFSEIIL